MSIEIAQYIEYLLIHRGTVSLPGLGSISLIQKPAYFTQGKTKINPPSLDFDFTESNDGVQPELLNFIALSESVDSATVETDLNKFSQNILNDFLNYDQAKIPSLGMLRKEGSNTIFIPNGTLTSKAYHGLQPLGLTPSTKIKKEKTYPSSTPPLKKDWDWVTYLGALILGAAMILAYHHFINPLESYNSTKTAETSTSTRVPDRRDEAPTDLSTTADTQSLDKSINVDLLVPNNQDSVAKQDNLKTREELTILPETKKIRKEKKMTSDSSSLSIAQPKKDQKCIILVGVYNKAIEALVMSDRIKAKGYTPFRDVKYDANRVGIQFNCAERDAKEMLEEIKAKFNNDAYYLQPNITI